MRTPDEIAADYKEFRGRCKELAEKAFRKADDLRLVRGHYFCPIWNTEEPHWWCEREDGSIVDPSARQFPSNGAGIYTEFDGMCTCSNCGKEIREEEASFDSNYVFCSYRCHGQFVGIY